MVLNVFEKPSFFTLGIQDISVFHEVVYVNPMLSDEWPDVGVKHYKRKWLYVILDVRLINFEDGQNDVATCCTDQRLRMIVEAYGLPSQWEHRASLIEHIVDELLIQFLAEHFQKIDVVLC